MSDDPFSRAIGDVLSWAVLLLTWFTAWLPQFATFFTVVWMMIRIWETKTVQRLIGRKPEE